VLKRGHFIKQIRSNCKVLKCVAEEGRNERVRSEEILQSQGRQKYPIKNKNNGNEGKRGRRRKQPMDDLRETRGSWKFKHEALDCSLWGTRFGKKPWVCRKTL
jgi:hypothetical protein